MKKIQEQNTVNEMMKQLIPHVISYEMKYSYDKNGTVHWINYPHEPANKFQVYFY